jgi:hypothetical protein
MTGRLVALCSALTALALLAGCGTSSQLSSISVTPATATIPGVGSTAQFTAVGTFSNGKKNTSYTQTLTTQVTWSSSVNTVATVNSSGLATGVSTGTTTITAIGGNGSIQGQATLTVGTATGGSHNLTSLTVIPAPFMQTVNQIGETAQYIAIGTFTGTPATEDLTNQVSWTSSDVRIATINSAGLATAVGDCGGGMQVTNITAIAPPSTGGAVGTSNLTLGTCGTNNLPTLTVYEVGQGTGTVTSVPIGIDCTSGAGCTGHFVLGTQVTLTAVPAPGSVFSGWSANCVPDNQPTCSITMPNNETVGAIFNLAQ